MFRRLLLCVTFAAGLAIAGSASEAEARGCYRGGFYGGYGGGYYRAARYYGGPRYYHGPSIYRRSYYGGYPAYYGGFHPGYRSGVTLSFGW